MRGGETMRERNRKIMKNQRKVGWRSRKGGEMRLKKNTSEKMGTILKWSKWSKIVFLTKHRAFLQITCRAMFCMFAVGTLKWENKV